MKNVFRQQLFFLPNVIKSEFNNSQLEKFSCLHNQLWKTEWQFFQGPEPGAVPSEEARGLHSFLGWHHSAPPARKASLTDNKVYK
ncbi:hypothetical protein PBY51_019318 [Eleginops maclovinus]|uniref:Uncharacterized protein n=1 Tax=Eleginops maclovinus TaxID=56733 RepID=A0AAN7Y691_ELEMC|nr:hypothetical protein PBY51_019318 [Eleginops maclovinus]